MLPSTVEGNEVTLVADAVGRLTGKLNPCASPQNVGKCVSFAGKTLFV
jgi:hypothetical protein